MPSPLDPKSFTAIFDALVDGLAVHAPDGQLLHANARLAELLGFDSVPELQQGLAFFAERFELSVDGRVLPPEEWPVARGARGESVRDWRVRVWRREPPEERFFTFSIEPVRDEHGVVKLVVVVTRDVTEPTRLHQALQESEERLAAIHRASPFGIVLSRVANQTIVSVNDAYLELTGYRREELIGQTSVALGLLPAEARTRLMETLEAQGRLRDVDVVLRRRDGSSLTISLNVDVITLHGEQVMLSTMLDVTAKREALRQLHESEARYRALFEQQAIGVAQVDTTNGLILTCNDKLCHMLGYPLEELRTTTWHALTHPEDLPRNLREVRVTVEVGKPYRTEKRFLRKDGSVLWARVTVTPIKHAFGEHATHLVLIEDVSEQRLITEQLQQAQKLESIGRLAGGVAHDFNNLLTVILSCAETLQLDLEEGRAPEPEDVKEIVQAGHRARELTGQLLAFARRQYVDPVDVDLNAVVERSRKMLARLVGEDVELRTTFEPSLVRVWADTGQVEQVLVNLAVNARDAMPTGGVLEFTTSNRVYPAGHPRAGTWAVLAVRDSGVGMGPDVQAHLFEPFFTTKAPGKGTGLGLATAYGIVSGAGGFIDVHSSQGAGSTFEVLLPRTERVAAPRQGGLRPRGERGHETVLVVEDDAQVREVTLRALRGAGYVVLGAAGPEEALALAPEALQGVNLLVTDVVMPTMNGRELAQALKARHERLCVLYVSGYTRDVIVDRGVLEPGAEFLAKPYTPATLLTRVRGALDTPAAR